MLPGKILAVFQLNVIIVCYRIKYSEKIKRQPENPMHWLFIIAIIIIAVYVYAALSMRSACKNLYG